MRNIKSYKVKGRKCLKIKGMTHNIGEFRDVQSEEYKEISIGFRDSKIIGDIRFSDALKVRFQ